MAAEKGRVGFVGLGIMGTALSANLAKAGFEVIGFDIDATRMEALTGNGGHSAASAGDVAQRCDLIVTSLPSPEALHATVSGPGGILSAKRKGLILSECSTLALADKERARAALAAGGVAMLDSPLSGTGSQAARKDILVYSSGERTAYDAFVPVYREISRASHYLGAFGNGSRMKYVANLLVAIHNVAAAEAIVLAERAGLDPAEAHRVISDGGGSSKMFEVRGGLMAEGRYTPAQMKIDLFMKDLDIIGNFAAGLHCPTPLFSASVQVHTAALAQGHAKDDTAAVHAVLEQMAGGRGT
jgi:3-hydroxyisobutyrate dehydrogenase-like beta-hydroxyacid dehydrogenase